MGQAAENFSASSKKAQALNTNLNKNSISFLRQDMLKWCKSEQGYTAYSKDDTEASDACKAAGGVDCGANYYVCCQDEDTCESHAWGHWYTCDTKVADFECPA